MSTIPVNRTIDDTTTRDKSTKAYVNYNVPWVAQPNECPKCLFQPNTRDVMNGTWHYSRTNVSDVKTPAVSFSLTFPGTAIYVYGVAFKKMTFERNEFAITNLSFILDGQPSLPNYYADPLTSGYQYDTLVYSHTGLMNGTHVLQVSLVDALNSSRFNAFMFDYANYTFETSASFDAPLQVTSETKTAASVARSLQATSGPLTTMSIEPMSSISKVSTSTTSSASMPSPMHHKVEVGKIIGITLGVFALVGFVIGILLCYFLRRRNRRSVVVSGGTNHLSGSARTRLDSPYLTDTHTPHISHETRPNGTSKQREVSARRARRQQEEARNIAHAMSHTAIPLTYNSARG